MRTPFLVACCLAVLFAAGCNKSNNGPDIANQPYSSTVNPNTIAVGKLRPHAVEYYKDFAVLAEWYVDHPAALQAGMGYNATHSEADSGYNGLLAELAELNLEDSTGRVYSFFELPDDMRHALLRDYVKDEAKFLSEKLDMAGEGADNYVAARNAAADAVTNTPHFTDSMDFDAAAASITVADPYPDIMEDVDDYLMPIPGAAPPNEGMSMNELMHYLATMRILGVAVGPFDYWTKNNNTQNFVDKMRPHIQKGRVLVALPGGNETSMPIASEGNNYDFGHVAIVVRDAGEVPSRVPDDFALTIGTNSSDNMHYEPLKKDWVEHHGKSYLMEPVRKKREWKWGWGFVPYWETKIEGVDNNKTCDKIKETLGRTYATWQIPWAKHAAPQRFICSSSAWWAIDQAHDINISDWSLIKPTIFPSGVFESSDMRVVAKTF